MQSWVGSHAFQTVSITIHRVMRSIRRPCPAVGRLQVLIPCWLSTTSADLVSRPCPCPVDGPFKNPDNSRRWFSASREGDPPKLAPRECMVRKAFSIEFWFHTLTRMQDTADYSAHHAYKNTCCPCALLRPRFDPAPDRFQSFSEVL